MYVPQYGDPDIPVTWLIFHTHVLGEQGAGSHSICGIKENTVFKTDKSKIIKTEMQFNFSNLSQNYDDKEVVK